MDILKEDHFNEVPIGYDKGWILRDSAVKGVLIDNSNNEIIDDEKSWSADLEEIHTDSTKSHWIDVYERKCVLDSIINLMEKDNVVIEFGAGAGYMIELLRDYMPQNMFVATDLMGQGLKASYERNPDICHIKCNFTLAPFKDNSVDLVYSLNVLEHIEDDIAAIKECYRMLKNGGHAVFVVPKGDKLYDYYDEALYHKRRYANGELRGKCEACGFSVIDNNHIAALVYPAFWIKKKWNRYQWRKGQLYEKSMAIVEKDIEKTKNSKLAALICKIESILYKRIKFKRGIREIIVLQK